MSAVPLWVSVLVIGASVLAVIGAGTGVYLTPQAAGVSRRKHVSASAATGALLAAWLLLSLTSAGKGIFRARVDMPFPPIALGVVAPIVIGYGLFRFSAKVRLIADSIPQHWLLAAQTPRVLGAAFLVLVAQQKLPPVFGLPAGLGDMLVGAAAPLAAYWYVAARSRSRAVAIAFNIFGVVDLIVAVGTGFLAAPSPFRLIFTTPSTELMTILPLVLIPTFLVPAFILVHMLSLRQLMLTPAAVDGGEGTRGSGALTPLRASASTGR